ncbi:hypothetical protein [Humisphaera borealis]|uniref:Uncharacterized protein n=1 Tax=Humisphaera borealis TaxID=2807512 RepID=A0A7M2WVE1_9BACT|nr:hypothetical protein [Humisphaera borealis]QOV89426.1 hypothetical protein IPV69_25045 [Humisphaera borealis]
MPIVPNAGNDCEDVGGMPPDVRFQHEGHEVTKDTKKTINALFPTADPSDQWHLRGLRDFVLFVLKSTFGAIRFAQCRG